MSDHDQSTTDVKVIEAQESGDQNQAISTARRDLLLKMAKGATYAAPVTIALMSMQAKACSFSC